MNAQATSSPQGNAQTDQRASFASRWAALQDAASAVALMAGREPEATSARIRNYPALVKNVGGWRYEMALRGLEDLSAIMQPGLTALLAVNARGLDATAPARALWTEFEQARDAMLALCPEGSGLGPQRSA